MPAKQNLIGKRFGRLLVLEGAGRDQFKHLLWKCRCDCGNVVTKVGAKLKLPHRHSCGCWMSEIARHNIVSKTKTHGKCNTPEYAAWAAMRGRCLVRSHGSYKRYGAIGITVCKRWDDFSLFLLDMGEKPSRSHSIERRDNTKGYSPENCYWATPKEQARNRRSNINITIGGITKCLNDWAIANGIDPTRAQQRIKRHGWDPIVAVTTPHRKITKHEET